MEHAVRGDPGGSFLQWSCCRANPVVLAEFNTDNTTFPSPPFPYRCLFRLHPVGGTLALDSAINRRSLGTLHEAATAVVEGVKLHAACGHKQELISEERKRSQNMPGAGKGGTTNGSDPWYVEKDAMAPVDGRQLVGG